MMFACAAIGQDIGSSQVNPSPKLIASTEVYIGPAVGFLRGNVDVDNTIQNTRKMRTGFSVGVGFSHRFSRNLNLNIKLLYENKGGISELSGTYYDSVSQSLRQGTAEFSYRFNYYSLRILVDFTPLHSERLRVGCGPFVSCLQKQT